MTAAVCNPVFTPEALTAFLGRLVERTDSFWRDDHWVDHRTTYNWVHANTSIYYILAYARMSGDVSRIDKIRRHYAWSKQTKWVEQAKCWLNPTHEVMANACVDLNIACALSAGAEFLPADLRSQMEDDLKSSLTWLEHKTTGALNDADLRACNQDCIAAAAFAMAAKYFHDDPAFRKMGLDRYRLVLAKSAGPFWTEGGVDKGYQIVGEPAFALAVDQLWSDLSLAEKRRASEILMRPYAAPTLGLEKMRSESTLGSEPDGSLASAYLHRVHNPWIERDVIETMGRRQALGNPWWFMDTPQVAYYVGVLENAPMLSRVRTTTRDIGWGGTARLGMQLDEYGRRGSIDEKTYLASPDGLVALFGDVSGWNPQYAVNKRKITAPQKQLNPGGLRYVGKDRTVMVWAEGMYDLPRLVFGDAVAADGAPVIVSQAMRPGFVGSQYDLLQSLKQVDGRSGGGVLQQFVVVGRTLLARMAPDATAAALPALRYEITVPTAAATVDAARKTVAWVQGSLCREDPVTQQRLTLLHGGTITWDQAHLVPYLVNEPIRNWLEAGGTSFQSIKPDTVVLTRAIVPVGPEPTWFALSTGVGDAASAAVHRSLTWEQRDGGEIVTCVDGDHADAVVYFTAEVGAQPPETFTIDLGGATLQFVHPAPGVFHVVSMAGGQLQGIMTRAAGVTLNGKPILISAARQSIADISLMRAAGFTFLDVASGAMQVANLPGTPTSGASLITGEPVDLRQPVGVDRVCIR